LHYNNVLVIYVIIMSQCDSSDNTGAMNLIRKWYNIVSLHH